MYWKCPAENARDGISDTLNLKRFGESMPQTPPGFGRLQRANVFFPCVHLQNLTLRCQLPASLAYEINAQGWKKRLSLEGDGGGGGGEYILKIVIAKERYNCHM